MSSFKKSALWVGGILPEPDSSAAGLRAWGLIEALRSAGWTVVAIVGSDGSQSPRSSSARFKDQKISVIEVGPNDLDRDLGAEVRAVLPEGTNGEPEIIIYEYFWVEEQYSWRLRGYFPRAFSILDTCDLHFLRRARETLITDESDGTSHPLDLGLFRDVKKSASQGASQHRHHKGRVTQAVPDKTVLRELGSILRSDLTLVVSHFEYRLLIDSFGISKDRALWLPFAADPWAMSGADDPVPFEGRKGLVWIGNFRHPPNMDAIRWLHREIWPQARALARSEGKAIDIDIFGAYIPKEVSLTHDPSQGWNIRGPFDGDARALRAHLARYRAMVVPLRYGAGLKGKILCSWSAGTPVVATEVAQEGFFGDRAGDAPPGAGVEDPPAGGKSGFPGLIGTSAVSMAEAMVVIDRDDVQWSQWSSQSIQLTQDVFSQSAVSARFISSLEDLAAQGESVRQRNWVQRVLWHESHGRTEYFSRWLREKSAKSV